MQRVDGRLRRLVRLIDGQLSRTFDRFGEEDGVIADVLERPGHDEGDDEATDERSSQAGEEDR